MIFAPVCLDGQPLEREALAEDKKNCRRFGPCGVGAKALYLNSFFFDRRYYLPLESVRRAFKRVAMSQGGFTGKGVFGAIPYLVVEYGDGTEKQCNFKHEEDVDRLLDYLAQVRPEIPRRSVKAQQRLDERAAEEAARYLPQLSTQAESAREDLERAQAVLDKIPDKTGRLAAAAKAKRINDRTNPAYKWVALAIVLAGAAAMVYGILKLTEKDQTGIYFALMGLAAIFFFSGAQVLPTARNNRKTVSRNWEKALADMQEAIPARFPVPAQYAHPIVLTRMIRILREGRAQTAKEALEVLKSDLRALKSSVQVTQEEYDEVVVIKPLFLVCDYQ